VDVFGPISRLTLIECRPARLVPRRFCFKSAHPVSLIASLGSGETRAMEQAGLHLRKRWERLNEAAKTFPGRWAARRFEENVFEQSKLNHTVV
jgi:hypothetical protein